MFTKSDTIITLNPKKNCLLKLFAVSCTSIVQQKQHYTGKPTFKTL